MMAEEAVRIPSEDEKRDFESGLNVGNCLKLMKLLRECPRLVFQTWRGARPSTTPESDPLEIRTALHVGAMRGCPELIGMVLREFIDEEVDTPGEAQPSERIHSAQLQPGDEKFLTLNDLLKAKDPEYKLDALEIARFYGNWEVMYKLARVSYKCDGNPYDITKEVLRNSAEEWKRVEAGASADAQMIEEIQRITQEVVGRSGMGRKLQADYNDFYNLNFLPWETYLFFCIFDSNSRKVHKREEIRQQIFNRVRASTSLQTCFLGLRDGRGRTVLHASVQHGTAEVLLKSVGDASGAGKLGKDWVKVQDNIGRTALHWAAALGNDGAVGALTRYGGADLLNATFDVEAFDVGGSKETGTGDTDPAPGMRDKVTALHLAILHKQESCLEVLLKCKNLDLTGPGVAYRSDEHLGLLQMAAYGGSAPVMRLLLQDGRALRDLDDEDHFSPVHIAAGLGDFELLKTLLDHGSLAYDPFIQDGDGNTALHHVMLGIKPDYFSHFHLPEWASPRLPQFISLDDFKKSHVFAISNNIKEEEHGEKSASAYTERKGCVELLLQAGLDPWLLNKSNEAAYPGRNAPPEFLSWWYEKLSKETIAAQNTLNAAANAVSVTAALVATASYVGPLQPPLGFSDNTNHLEVGNWLVRTFIVCDTLSMFLAVASIMMALIPAIPLPHQSSRAELKRTRRNVITAVGLLFPSIIFVLVAFAAASTAVIPSEKSQKYGGLTIVAVAVGGTLSLAAIGWFLIRVVVVLDIFPKLRKFYDRVGF